MSMPSSLQENFDISFLSTFRTKAMARYYYEIITREDITQLVSIFAFARQESIPITLIGGGTNCLFAFDMYPGIIIRNRFVGYSEPYEQDGRTYMNVHSGELTTALSIRLSQHYSIATLIPWVGLPGTMGGACIGNAGCFGMEMSDILIQANILDLTTGEISLFSRADMDYHYRESILKGDTEKFVIDMVIDITPKNGKYEEYSPIDLQALRKTKQPAGFSCGSFFKNPSLTESAGKLIDQAGLKGTRVGGVHVSEQHGNFFINDGSGTWKDILSLRDILQKKVYDTYGIILREEVRIISLDS